ncbi:MBL fold metallo-hydrolase [Devriesea agamarum]|uniref:MBL fold metallo-hydrolase n=1 Tax=Devriesea agamarum TaxID=472569 RepID=UPI00071C738B|nr:MBL fold metallo-hydrolase [Devriesea agamarum]
MRVTIIGCAGSYAGPHSPASSYLFHHRDAAGKKWNVLFDIGNGALGTLQRVLDPGALDAVVISHLHPDHFLDLAGLEVFRAYYPGRVMPQLPVYAPSDLRQRFLAVTGNDSDCPVGARSAPFAFNPLAEGQQLHIGPFRLTVRRVNHPVEAYGFRVETDQPGDGFACVAYSGDTDSCPALVDLARDVDLFLCEAGYLEGRDDAISNVHLTGRRAGQAAQAAGAKRLVLTHIPAWTDPELTRREAAAVYDGPLELAVSGAELHPDS